jgi:hypothetical protein
MTEESAAVPAEPNVNDGLRRFYINPENGHIVETQRGPWVRYVDVKALIDGVATGEIAGKGVTDAG